eukprot:7384853-Prymnesium_polylepis.2
MLELDPLTPEEIRAQAAAMHGRVCADLVVRSSWLTAERTPACPVYTSLTCSSLCTCWLARAEARRQGQGFESIDNGAQADPGACERANGILDWHPALPLWPEP